MPFKSDAQRKFMHAHPEKLGPRNLKHWDEATKGKKLPEHVSKHSGKEKRAMLKQALINYTKNSGEDSIFDDFLDSN